ncbi:CbiX/SirB N-terminal domain-containing protein [Halorutilales archaeon Cl-col2-1]
MSLNSGGDCVVLVGHGSRREESNQQVRRMASMLQDSLGIEVKTGFIELAEPSIEDAADEAADEYDSVTVIPFSLFGASHVKNDVSLEVNQARSRNPETEFYYGRHLGVHPSMAEIVDDRVAAVEDETGIDRDDDDLTVVLCARGSSDPDANADAHKLSRLVYEGREYDVETSFIGITQPLLDETLHTVSKSRPDAVVVVPYMLGDGVLTQRIHDTAEEFDSRYPYMDVESGGHIGTDDKVIEALIDRWEEARGESVEMSCDTCKYKVELEGFEDDLGGARARMRALSNKVEHSYRDEVDDDPHVHDRQSKHAVVCTNQTCAKQGSLEVLESLRNESDDDVKITRSSCLGRCGDGPMVAVYPDGVWYSGVDEEDADEIARSHFEDDEVVGRLVDQII